MVSVQLVESNYALAAKRTHNSVRTQTLDTLDHLTGTSGDVGTGTRYPAV
jgi:hypothetical protein